MGGRVWIGANHVAEREGIEDNLERVETYVRAIAHNDPELLDEDAMERWLTAAPHAARYWEEVGAIQWTVIPGLTDYHSQAAGAMGVGRYLTNQLIDGRELGEWQSKLRRSPHFRVGVTYDRTSPSAVASVRARAARGAGLAYPSAQSRSFASG
jgi:3-oxosteroid 1-dehydrogenase